MTEPKNKLPNADLREEIRAKRLTRAEVAKHLPNHKQGGKKGITTEALRFRLDNPMTAKQREEIREAIAEAFADITGII